MNYSPVMGLGILINTLRNLIAIIVDLLYILANLLLGCEQ